ncbi:MAG TPA: glycosyltransferase family 4 protein [Frankiaceae bacterium]|nr:glycosyltransferase family 4 protein [Frankiaceae bacterium]
MKVVLALGPSTGGIGRHVQALAAFLVDSGVAMTTVGPAETLERFPVAGAVRPGLSVAAVRRAARGADVVHAHGVRAGSIAAAALLGRRVPLVVTWHNLVGTGGRAGRLVQTLVARRAAVSLCVSPDLVAHVTRLGGRPRLAPVGAARRAPSGRSVDETRAELGLTPGIRLVLAVARLNRQKGLDVLQAAAVLLPADVVVAVAGEGPERDRLGAPLRLLGARDDVADLLAAADVVVLPSRWEGSPLAAHEALLAGRPLVATAVGGVPALVGSADPPAAVLVPAEDPEALADALRRLLDDPAEAAALAERGRRRAAEWPDAARTVTAVLEVYRQLLGEAD